MSVALVTGAARGQGRSHAVRLARDGHDLVLVDLAGPLAAPYPPATPADLAGTQRLVAATGRRVLARRADVRDAAALRAVVEEAAAELGAVDVVVAGAGIAGGGPAAELPPDAWDAVVDTDLTGVWNTVQAALPGMVAARRGAVVLIGSANGGLKAPPHLAHYAAAKHGVAGLVRALAAELGPLGIRVNGVHPTAVDTPMIHNEATYRLFGVADRAGAAEAFAGLHPLGVPWVQPEDVSAAVAFLVSEQARFVTGVALAVDAGLSVR